jgi:hypothetical protein
MVPACLPLFLPSSLSLSSLSLSLSSLSLSSLSVLSVLKLILTAANLSPPVARPARTRPLSPTSRRSARSSLARPRSSSASSPRTRPRSPRERPRRPASPSLVPPLAPTRPSGTERTRPTCPSRSLCFLSPLFCPTHTRRRRAMPPHTHTHCSSNRIHDALLSLSLSLHSFPSRQDRFRSKPGAEHCRLQNVGCAFAQRPAISFLFHVRELVRSFSSSAYCAPSPAQPSASTAHLLDALNQDNPRQLRPLALVVDHLLGACATLSRQEARPAAVRAP